MNWATSVDATKLSAWATAVSAIGSIVVAVATYWLGKLTRVLAKETQLAREDEKRADVQCALESNDKSISLIDLIIVNIGKASAQDVIVKVKRGGHFTKDEKPVFTFFRVLPEKKLRLFMGSYLQMDEKTIEIKISFKDALGSHHFSYEQDLKAWEHITTFNSNPAFEIADSITKIGKLLDRWSRNGRLNVDIFDEDDRKRWPDQV